MRCYGSSAIIVSSVLPILVIIGTTSAFPIQKYLIRAGIIDIAEKAGKLNSDNKKRGNPQKVDEFRQAELEQYLEEALFLLELVGIKVFKKDSKKQRKGTRPITIVSTAQSEEAQSEQPQTPIQAVPPLPAEKLKIGEFVYTAMQNLSESGFSFDSEKLMEMTTSDWSIATFHTKQPFMKLYTPGETDNKGLDGRVRYKSVPYTFGQHQVLITKEWYERQRQFFIDWYNSL